MFISREEITQRSGYDIDLETLLMAQTMIEVWVGRTEAQVDDAGDLAVLGNATLFQAIYINESPEISLEQAAVLVHRVESSSDTLDTEKFAPFIAPWAWKACQRLSWFGTRTINTGPIFDRKPVLSSWETT